RISVAIDTPLVPGMRITLDRGMPVTLVDGGRELAMRTRPGTVADFLGMAGVSLGGQDIAVTPLDAIVSPGAVIRIDRVADREVVEVHELPFTVTVVEDTGYEFGWSRIDRAGSTGEVRQTFIIRAVNGVENERVLVSTTELRAPVNEVRRIGARPRPAPAAPAEIEALIRAAAARYGADPQQLLRVAWCESRYDPSAYNGILGASGLFQIIPGTWAANSVRAGYAGASVWDAYANANVAAWMFARGQAGQWACK
ncbi:MAG TPA: G5 domain-containing protein, partial [Candidatus Saccharimonadales bacterium]|nr:G5 domain-containing protein [Candidatus Saccharimonadales bacterium]